VAHFRILLDHSLESTLQVSVADTAKTTEGKFVESLFPNFQELAFEGRLSEFVDDQAELATRTFLEEAVDQSRLSRTEKAREDRDRDRRV
jgi:hypothetical protein